jgi:hypothetical protein
VSEFVPADQAIKAAEAAWEAKWIQDSPYRPVEGNPFEIDCPVDECQSWAISAEPIAVHLAARHPLIGQLELARLLAQQARRRATTAAQEAEVVGRAASIADRLGALVRRARLDIDAAELAQELVG